MSSVRLESLQSGFEADTRWKLCQNLSSKTWKMFSVTPQKESNLNSTSASNIQIWNTIFGPEKEIFSCHVIKLRLTTSEISPKKFTSSTNGRPIPHNSHIKFTPKGITLGKVHLRQQLRGVFSLRSFLCILCAFNGFHVSTSDAPTNVPQNVLELFSLRHKFTV